jgi:hypothetical protein
VLERYPDAKNILVGNLKSLKTVLQAPPVNKEMIFALIIDYYSGKERRVYLKDDSAFGLMGEFIDNLYDNLGSVSFFYVIDELITEKKFDTATKLISTASEKNNRLFSALPPLIKYLKKLNGNFGNLIPSIAHDLRNLIKAPNDFMAIYDMLNSGTRIQLLGVFDNNLSDFILKIDDLNKILKGLTVTSAEFNAIINKLPFTEMKCDVKQFVSLIKIVPAHQVYFFTNYQDKIVKLIHTFTDFTEVLKVIKENPEARNSFLSSLNDSLINLIKTPADLKSALEMLGANHPVMVNLLSNSDFLKDKLSAKPINPAMISDFIRDYYQPSEKRKIFVTDASHQAMQSIIDNFAGITYNAEENLSILMALTSPPADGLGLKFIQQLQSQNIQLFHNVNQLDLFAKKCNPMTPEKLEMIVSQLKILIHRPDELIAFMTGQSPANQSHFVNNLGDLLKAVVKNPRDLLNLLSILSKVDERRTIIKLLDPVESLFSSSLSSDLISEDFMKKFLGLYVTLAAPQRERIITALGDNIKYFVLNQNSGTVEQNLLAVKERIAHISMLSSPSSVKEMKSTLLSALVVVITDVPSLIRFTRNNDDFNMMAIIEGFGENILSIIKEPDDLAVLFRGCPAEYHEKLVGYLSSELKNVVDKCSDENRAYLQSIPRVAQLCESSDPSLSKPPLSFAYAALRSNSEAQKSSSDSLEPTKPKI